jgi:GalNAc-alpha-(1->4)-GalNAc-alpha-(1->3)-diNAcBac-PP-undecaprenol alpha-1,4-N-acetyl-D-galactosaminyltransferase
MDVLFAFDDLRGGAGKVAFMIAKELAHNHKVSIVLLDNRSESTIPNEFNIDLYSIQTNIEGNRKTTKLIRSILDIRQVIKHISPDVVISMITNTNVIVGLSMILLHIPIFVCERTNPSYRKTPIHWLIMRSIVYMFVDKIIVQTIDASNFGYSIYKHKSSIIPNPIIIPYITKTIANQESEVQCIAVGRLNRVKGFDMLIESFCLAYRDDNRLRLSIYGQGPEEARLNQQIELLGCSSVIKLCGYSDNIAKHMYESDIYILSSRTEGFPNALMEAMSLGLPSIAFNCHSGPGELIEDGYDGRLIPVGNIEELATSLLELASNHEMQYKFSKNSIESMKRFDLEIIVKRWDMLVVNCVKFPKVFKEHASSASLRKHIKQKETWFSIEDEDISCDILYCINMYSKGTMLRSLEKATLIVDLLKDEQDIFGGIEKQVRYEIRRASEKDMLNCLYICNPEISMITTIYNSYNRFACDKGIPRMSVRSYISLLRYANAGKILVSTCGNASHTYIYHVYYISKGVCRLLHSISLFRSEIDHDNRSMIGRANRLLHWKDYQYFKREGFIKYDWGGYHIGTNEELLRINAFKKSFGGTVVPTFQGYMTYTFKGKVWNQVHKNIVKIMQRVVL